MILRGFNYINLLGRIDIRNESTINVIVDIHSGGCRFVGIFINRYTRFQVGHFNTIHIKRSNFERFDLERFNLIAHYSAIAGSFKHAKTIEEVDCRRSGLRCAFCHSNCGSRNIVTYIVNILVIHCVHAESIFNNRKLDLICSFDGRLCNCVVFGSLCYYFIVKLGSANCVFDNRKLGFIRSLYVRLHNTVIFAQSINVITS